MGSTIIDSRIFGNMFATDAMREVWSDKNRTAQYLAIERALAIVQGRLGIIPQEAADEIARNCDVDQDRHGQAAAADRAHRLSDSWRCLAAQRAMP